MARRIKASRWPSVLAEVLLLPLALLASPAHAVDSTDAAAPNAPAPAVGADDANLAGANGQDVYLDVTLNGSARGIVHFGDRDGQLWASAASLRAFGFVLPAGTPDPVRRVTVARANQVIELDGEAALPCLLRDLGIGADAPRQLVERLRQTLVGLSDPGDEALGRGGQFGTDTRVRHVIGIDPGHETVAVADIVEPGMRLAFCRRDAAAARRDLVRICSEIREELSEALPDPAPALPGRPPAAAEAPQTQRRIAGAIYVSCAGRGGPHFGAPSAEAQIVRHALGDVPLVGLFAGGEIARHHLYGYTGVLTVFVER